MRKLTWQFRTYQFFPFYLPSVLIICSWVSEDGNYQIQITLCKSWICFLLESIFFAQRASCDNFIVFALEIDLYCFKPSLSIKTAYGHYCTVNRAFKMIFCLLPLKTFIPYTKHFETVRRVQWNPLTLTTIWPYQWTLFCSGETQWLW